MEKSPLNSYRDSPKSYEYNFVYLFAGEDYWHAIFGSNNEHTEVRKSAICAGPILTALFRLHWSYKLNCIFSFPLKRLWFRKIYKTSFNTDLPLCFIFVGGNRARFSRGFRDYIQKKNPKNRVVILHEDLIEKKINYDYNILRKLSDLCISYDAVEAKKYNIEFFSGLTYTALIPDNNCQNFENDVYFLGAAKDRLPKIIAAYDYLEGNSLKCKFLIAGAPKANRVYRKGITYLDRNISYRENLKNVIMSKCILEISQQGASGISLRALEAIVYHRRLITDIKSVKSAWFHDGQILRFSRIDEIDILKASMPIFRDSYPSLIDTSPEKRLFFIQDKLKRAEDLIDGHN